MSSSCSCSSSKAISLVILDDDDNFSILCKQTTRQHQKKMSQEQKNLCVSKQGGFFARAHKENPVNNGFFSLVEFNFCGAFDLLRTALSSAL